MNWFQRYGIPGAYFECMTIVLFVIFYPCMIELDDNTLKIIAGVFTASFLPVGYLLTMFSQCLFWLETWIGANSKILPCLIYKGMHVKSAEEAKVKLKYPHKDMFAKYELEIASLSALNVAIKHNGCVDLDAQKFVQEWAVKRMDVVVMNQTMIWATLLSMIIIFLLQPLLFNWSLQPESSIFKWLVPVTAFLILLILFIITKICRKQIEILVAGIFEHDSKKHSTIIKRNE